MDDGMHGTPRLLLWNYTQGEKQRIDEFLEKVKAPPAYLISNTQGYLTVRDILHTDTQGEQVFECHEKVVLFYNIPSKGISFLIDQFRQQKFPQPIYAAVTEHSIDWPLHELIAELVEEREAFQQVQKASQ